MDYTKEKKNNYPWDSLETTTLMLPIEIITYHLYRYENRVKTKRTSEESKELELIKSYMQKEKSKEVEVGKCFQK